MAQVVINSDPKNYEQYEYDVNKNLVYLGKNDNTSAGDDDDGWVITKFSYDANYNVIKKKTFTGTWNTRGSLPFGF